MPANKDDVMLLMDVTNSCLKILDTTIDIEYNDFENNYRIHTVVERLLEVIGEASKRLSHETRDTLDHIPWKSIIGLRNIIAHDYDEIMYEFIWETATIFVPELLNNLNQVDSLKDYINQEKMKYEKTKDMEFQ